MVKVEVTINSIRQALLKRNVEYPWVVILKSKSSSYLPVYISKSQADLIQKLLLDDDPIPIESFLEDLCLPIEQMKKGILDSIIIESLEENNYQAKLILKQNNKANGYIKTVLPVGNGIALSFITKVPIFVDEVLLMHVDGIPSY